MFERTQTQESSSRLRIAARVWVAALDATLIVFGLWWLRGVSMPWLPKSVFLVLLTLCWLGDFAKEVARD